MTIEMLTKGRVLNPNVSAINTLPVSVNIGEGFAPIVITRRDTTPISFTIKNADGTPFNMGGAGVNLRFSAKEELTDPDPGRFVIDCNLTDAAGGLAEAILTQDQSDFPAGHPDDRSLTLICELEFEDNDCVITLGQSTLVIRPGVIIDTAPGDP